MFALLLGMLTAPGPVLVMPGSSPSLTASQTCLSAAYGDSCCYDNNGLQCGWPTTDALADDVRIFGHSASPIGAAANLVGQDIILAAGQGSMTLVATQANCGAGDTVSVTIDGTTTTCTRSATNDDDDEFTCGASNAAMATNMAACLNQATGVDACAGAGCTLFTGVSGTAYVYRASDEPGGGKISVASSGDHATAANGTDGVVQAWSNVLTKGQFANNNNVTSTPTGTTQTIDWNDGNYQTLSLASASGNVTLTLSNPIVGGSYILKIIQDETTARNIVWPAAAPDVKWPGSTEPTISTTLSTIDVVSLVYDGTNYYGSIVQDLR